MSDFSNNPVAYISDSLLNIIKSVDLSGLLTSLDPLTKKFYIILLIYTGLRLILGYGDVKESLSTIIKIIFIATILYSANYGFQKFVTPGILGARDFLVEKTQYSETVTSTITPAQKPTLYQELDKLGGKGSLIAESALNQFDWKHFSTYLYGIWGILVIIITIALIVLMTFTMLGAEIITLLLFAIGPIFIVLFLFVSTRNFFFLWISAVFSNVLLFTICSFFIALSVSVFTKIEEENNVIKVLTASKRLEEINNEMVYVNTNYANVGYIAMRGNKEADELRIEKGKRLQEIEENRKKEISAAEDKYNCTNYPRIINKISCSEISEITEINIRHDSEKETTTKKYDDKIKTSEENRKNEKEELEKIKKDNPITHDIYIGIIFLLAILFKITSEIPSIAQSLSGGMGAGASVAALAHQGIGMAKSATIGAISGVAGASYAALKWAKNKTSPPPPSPMQQMLEKVDTLSTQVQQQTALLERFDPRPAQPHPEPTPAPQLDGDPSPKPSPAEETKPGKIKDETHIAAPQDPQNAPEPAATPPQPSQLAEEKGQGATEAEAGKAGGNDSNKIDSPEKADVNVNTHVDADVIAKGGRNSGGDGGSPNNGLPSNAAHGASGIGGAIDSAQRESAQQQSQTGSNTQPSTPATSGGSGSKGTPSASNSTTPPAPQNEKKPSITDPKGNKPPKEPPIKKL